MRGIEKNGAVSRIFQSRIRDTREENFTVVVKTTMKFRSRFVRGNRIRIVSPSGSRNRQLSRVFSLKVTSLRNLSNDDARRGSTDHSLSKPRYSFL